MTVRYYLAQNLKHPECHILHVDIFNKEKEIPSGRCKHFRHTDLSVQSDQGLYISFVVKILQG